MLFHSPARKPLTSIQESVILFACFWFVGGLFLDGWAHNHLDSALETFFTPWHGVFYTGFGAVACSLLIFTWLNYRAGMCWREAIPAHYEYAMLGAALFTAGGLVDMIWHVTLGVEADLEALLSPPHLLLGIGLVLMTSGPARSWWRKTGSRQTLVEQLPLVLSLALMLSSFTFLTQYAYFVDKGPGGMMPPTDDAVFHEQAIAFLAYQIQTFLLMGCVFFVMQRTRLAFGFLTVLLTLNVFAMAFMRVNREFILAAFVAGLIGDALLQIVYRRKNVKGAIRVFAFLFPAILYALVMLTTWIGQGIWWSTHMWTGAIVIPGMAGLILSFVAWPMEEA
jgi:hypothetical protein